MFKFVWRLFFSLRTNNNMWLVLDWLLFIFWLPAHLIIFGFGSAISFPSYSTEIEENYNLYFHGAAKSNFELMSWYRKIWHSDFIVWIWDWLRFLDGIFLVILFILGFVLLIVLRDEVERAWRVAARKMREKEGRLVSPIAQPVVPGQAAQPPAAEYTGRGVFGRPLNLRNFLIWEFIADFLAELSLMRR